MYISLIVNVYNYFACLSLNYSYQWNEDEVTICNENNNFDINSNI